jgi:hypothetical protein
MRQGKRDRRVRVVASDIHSVFVTYAPFDSSRSARRFVAEKGRVAGARRMLGDHLYDKDWNPLLQSCILLVSCP